MLNIAMLSYHTCPLATLGGKDTGGMNVYVHELTRHLGEIGVHVDVFTRSQDEHVPHIIHELGYCNRVVHVPAGPEIPLPKLQLTGYLPAFAEGVRDFAARKGIHYDLIHSHYWMSGIAARSLQQDWGSPVIQMFHTLGKMKNLVAQSDAEREGAYRPDGEQQVLDYVDRVIAATPAEVEQLQRLYQTDPSKIAVIPPGVELSRFYPIPPDEARAALKLPPEKKLLLFVGRIEPLKGIDVLLRAIARMKSDGILCEHTHSLAIIGGDPFASGENLSAEMTRLQALRSDLGLENLVIFLGNRSQDTLPYYYSAAEVVIMPSHYESFGMVALEAMACGTPVVASQVGGLAYLVKDGVTGFVVPNGDAVSLAERLTRLITQPALRQSLGSQALAYARDYSWSTIASRILSIYLDVLSNKNPA